MAVTIVTDDFYKQVDGLTPARTTIEIGVYETTSR